MLPSSLRRMNLRRPSGPASANGRALQPTGRKVTLIGIDRYDGGKIAELWASLDDLGLLRQLGVVSLPK